LVITHYKVYETNFTIVLKKASYLSCDYPHFRELCASMW